MKVYVKLLILFLSGMIPLVILAGCQSDTVLTDKPDESSEDEVFELDEIIVPVGDTFSFDVNIHRVGHALSQGSTITLDHQATVVVLGEKGVVHGVGRGPGQFIPNLGDPCQLTCDYEIEYEVKGDLYPRPDCYLKLITIGTEQPGECISDCPTPGFTVPYPGGIIYDLPPLQFELIVGVIELDEVNEESVGNMHWTGRFEVSNFVGEPNLGGCGFEIGP